MRARIVCIDYSVLKLRRLKYVLRRRLTNLDRRAIELFDFARTQAPSERTEVVFELTHIFRARNRHSVLAHAPVESDLRKRLAAVRIADFSHGF